MNRAELLAARIIAKMYRGGHITLRRFHDLVYWRADNLKHTAREVWLSAAMQMAKGPAGVI